MWRLVLTLLLLALIENSFAASTCAIPVPSSVIYFGNGINTDRGSARNSLSLLQKELSGSYGDQKITYALAYNSTSGMSIDLAQAAAQSGTQNNRNIIRWLNGNNLTPNWFYKWFESYLNVKSLDVAKEVANHANFYLNDILDGKKVIVVSHSQGNFYVNEARELLARQLRGGKMSSFAIYGVAVPADNIGGRPGPYLTNHRDFIQKVPRSLPANWTLHHSDKKIADDLGPIQAHLFNATYMSDDFDIKPALIAGIRGQIDAAERPAHSCETFNESVLSMIAGKYMTTCGLEPNQTNKEMKIDGSVMTFPDKTSVDLSRLETVLILSQQIDRGSRAIEFGYLGGVIPAEAAAEWDVSRIFKYAAPPLDCRVTDKTPPTRIEKPFSISKVMLAPVQGLYRLLPPNSCTYDRSGKNEKPLEFSIDASTVRLGDTQWNFGAESEMVSLQGFDLRTAAAPVPFNDEPGFLLETTHGNHNFSLYYSRNKEIRWFSAVEINKSMTFCTFDMRGKQI